jgi:hypothetical protein
MINKLIKLTPLVACAFVIGCNSGTSTTAEASEQTLNAVSQSSASEDANSIPAIDSGTLVKSDGNDEQCTADKSICVNLKRNLIAYFIQNGSSRETWVTREINTSSASPKSGHFEVTFNAPPSKDFHLSRIYNKFIGDNNHEMVGHISQVDTSACDKFVQNGSYQEGSKSNVCTLNVVYHGDLYNDQKIQNEIHFVFSAGGKEILDYKKIAYNQVYTVQAVPALNFGYSPSDSNDTSYLLNSADANDSDDGLTYRNTFTNSLTNSGEAKMVPDKFPLNHGILDDFAIATSTTLSNIKNNSLYFWGSSKSHTSCGDSEIAPNGSCTFSFLDNTPMTADSNDAQELAPHYTHFLYQYQREGASSGNETSMRSTIFGYGDILMKDIHLAAPTESTTFTLNKINPGNNDGVSYLLELRNFNLSLSYNSSIHIGHQTMGNTVEYSYGDNEQNLISSGINNHVTLEYDKDCFQNMVDPNQDLSDMLVTKCSVTARLDKYALSKIENGPITLQLYASYISPVLNKQIKQFVGNIILSHTGATLNDPELTNEKVADSYDTDGSAVFDDSYTQYGSSKMLRLNLGDFIQTKNPDGTNYIMALQKNIGVAIFSCADNLRPCHVNDIVWSSGQYNQRMVRSMKNVGFYRTVFGMPLRAYPEVNLMGEYINGGTINVWNMRSNDEVSGNNGVKKLTTKGTFEWQSGATSFVLNNFKK